MSFEIEVQGGSSVRLPTAGKYCDRDIVVTATGGDTEGAYEEGYEAGQQSEYDRMWNIVTANGTREDYYYAFSHWGSEELKPPMKITPAKIVFMFSEMPELKRVSSKYFDFTQATELNGDYVNYAIFNACENLEDLSEMEFPAGGYSYTFYRCKKLRNAGTLNIAETDKFSRAFEQANDLEELVIKGTIGQNGFNVSWSAKLTHETLMRILIALKDYSEDTSGTTWKVTLGKTNLAKLTDAEKAIATEKGWTLV